MSPLRRNGIAFLLLQFPLVVLASDTIDTLRLPILTVESTYNKLSFVDTLAKSHRTDWELPGLSIREYFGAAPLRIGLFGNNPVGTFYSIDNLHWNDPRTGLADFRETPFWPISATSVKTGAEAGAQGGEVSLHLESPSITKRILSNVYFDSERNRGADFYWLGGQNTPVGIGFTFRNRPKGNVYPSIHDRRRDRFPDYGWQNFRIAWSPIVQKQPVELAFNLHHSERTVPGLVGRAVESESQETRSVYRFTGVLEKPFLIQWMIGTDRQRITRPALQYSPSGTTPFMPFDEESQWRGVELFTKHTYSMNRFTAVTGELRGTIDQVAVTDHITSDAEEATVTSGRSIYSTTVTFHRVLRQENVPIWCDGTMQFDGGYWWKGKLTRNYPSPRFAIGLSPSKKTKIELRFGDAIRWPTLTDLYLASTIFATGNPTLLPEHSREWNGEITYSNDWQAIHLIAYTRAIENGIVWKVNSRGQYTPRNIQETVSSGCVLTVEQKWWNQISGKASASYADSRIATKGDANRGNQLPLIPKIQMDTKIKYRLLNNDQHEAFVRCYYQSRRYTLEANTDPMTGRSSDLPPETIFDAGISWQLFASEASNTALTSSVTIRNIYNRQRWALEGVALPGRMLELSLQWTGW